MSEQRTPYHAGQPAPGEDEYHARRLGPGRFEVYRLVGDLELHYALCPTIDAALLIARALNLTAKQDQAEG